MKYEKGIFQRLQGVVGRPAGSPTSRASGRIRPAQHTPLLLPAQGPITEADISIKQWSIAPGFNQTPAVTNGFSDLILELNCVEAGAHARSSIGMMIPLNAPVNCETEVEIDGP